MFSQTFAGMSVCFSGRCTAQEVMNGFDDIFREGNK